MAFFDGMPSWLRWILFLPLALIASLFTWLIIRFYVCMITDLAFAIIGYHGSSPRMELFFGALAFGCVGFVLVWVGAWMAPKAKFFISIILAGLFSLWAGYELMEVFSVPNRTIYYHTYQYDIYYNVICLSAGLIGAVAACNSVYKKFR